MATNKADVEIKLCTHPSDSEIIRDVVTEEFQVLLERGITREEASLRLTATYLVGAGMMLAQYFRWAKLKASGRRRAINLHQTFLAQEIIRQEIAIRRRAKRGGAS